MCMEDISFVSLNKRETLGIHNGKFDLHEAIFATLNSRIYPFAKFILSDHFLRTITLLIVNIIPVMYPD